MTAAQSAALRRPPTDATGRRPSTWPTTRPVGAWPRPAITRGYDAPDRYVAANGSWRPGRTRGIGTGRDGRRRDDRRAGGGSGGTRRRPAPPEHSTIEHLFCGQPVPGRGQTPRACGRGAPGCGRARIGVDRRSARAWPRDAERGSAPTARSTTCCDAIPRATTTSCGFRLDHRPPAGVQFTGRSVAGRPPRRQGTRATRPADQGPGTKAADRSGGRPRSYASPHLRDRGTTTRTESLPYPATRLAPGKRTPAGTPIRTAGRHGEVPRSAGAEERNGNGPGSRGCPGHG